MGVPLYIAAVSSQFIGWAETIFLLKRHRRGLNWPTPHRPGSDLFACSRPISGTNNAEFSSRKIIGNDCFVF